MLVIQLHLSRHPDTAETKQNTRKDGQQRPDKKVLRKTFIESAVAKDQRTNQTVLRCIQSSQEHFRI